MPNPRRRRLVPRAGLEPAQTFVRRILSPLRLPSFATPALCFFWRRHPESNRGSRFCRPMPYHLAMPPHQKWLKRIRFLKTSPGYHKTASLQRKFSTSTASGQCPRGSIDQKTSSERVGTSDSNEHGSKNQ